MDSSVISKMKLLQLGDEREKKITDDDQALEPEWRWMLPHHLRKERGDEEKTQRDTMVNSVFYYLAEEHSVTQDFAPRFWPLEYAAKIRGKRGQNTNLINNWWWVTTKSKLWGTVLEIYQEN